VSTLAYFPYAVFNYVSPLMSVLIAVIGYKIKRSITDTSSAEN
jgi:NhaC family Na+:H+ antiporter